MLTDSLYNQILESVKNRKQTPGKLFDSLRLEQGEMRNDALGLDEILQSGYGSSFWDRYIYEWTPETLEAKRSAVRNEFIQQILVYILVALCVSIALFLLIKWLKSRQKKDKESEKELLIYIRKSHRSCNTESEGLDQ